MKNVPLEVLDQHTFVAGKTGAGKSFTLCGLVERLLDDGRRVCVVTPKGDWWGLKSSADGRKAGYKVLVFGGPHADIPINPSAGKEIAELVATGNRPCVIQFRGWMPNDRTRFWIDFASTLFNLNSAPLYLVIDEVHNFAPQGKVLDVEAGKSLHWTNRLASEGRGIGIQLIMASQRPQKVHKDTVTSAETLIAMRVIHPLDRGAIKEWVDGAGDAERAKMVLNSLAEMKRGEAFVWSPEIHYFERVKFPMIKSFDSFKAPTTNHEKMPVGWASVNLDDVKTRLARVIEEAKANDPALLKKKIHELEMQLRRKQAPPQSETQTKVALALRDKAVRDAYRSAEGQIARAQKVLAEYAEKVRRALSIPVPELPLLQKEIPLEKIVLPREPVAGKRQPVFSESTDEERPVKAGARRMISALIQWYPEGMTEGQMRAQAGMKKGGTYGGYKSNLKMSGLLEERGGLMYATQKAIDRFGENLPPVPRTTEEVLALWLPKFKKGARNMLKVLVERGGEPMTDEDLAREAGITETGGTYGGYKSNLRTARLIVTENGMVAANKETFFL